MLLQWQLYWPALAVALVIGIVTGFIAFMRLDRSRRGLLAIGAGIAATLAATALWHGPFGTADVFRHQAESTARTTLDHYEMNAVDARLKASPLNRTLLLSGPADDFQRSELIRILGDVPGVAEVQWQDSGQGSSHPLPMLAEVELWSLVAFGLGLLLSYLIALRRRASAEWRW